MKLEPCFTSDSIFHMHERLKYQKQNSDLKICREDKDFKSNKCNKKETDNFDHFKIKDVFHTGQMAHRLKSTSSSSGGPVSPALVDLIACSGLCGHCRHIVHSMLAKHMFL